jgi:hypothetical protein
MDWPSSDWQQPPTYLLPNSKSLKDSDCPNVLYVASARGNPARVADVDPSAVTLHGVNNDFSPRILKSSNVKATHRFEYDTGSLLRSSEPVNALDAAATQLLDALLGKASDVEKTTTIRHFVIFILKF